MKFFWLVTIKQRVQTQDFNFEVKVIMPIVMSCVYGVKQAGEMVHNIGNDVKRDEKKVKQKKN